MRILSRREVLELLSLRECIAAVERAFRLHAEGRSLGPGVLAISTARGGFHIKAAGLVGPRSYFAAKTNANFPDNPQRFGLPTIRGTVVLADAETGEPLAMMDSASLTALRTGASHDPTRDPPRSLGAAPRARFRWPRSPRCFRWSACG
jgi:ornithine cyclodeaminase/alanine dehydrogenase-like protein (mu-crystallin family)